MFAVWGCDEALGTGISFSNGREHVPKLPSVMRITSIIAKNALRNVVRDQLYVAGVVVRCNTDEFSEQLLVVELSDEIRVDQAGKIP